MIRSPLGLKLSTEFPLRDQIRLAATLGAKGVVVDAAGDLAPDRLSETGRREIRYLLRSVELSLIAVSLPTRRPFDTVDGLEDRLAKADRAFALAYELGTKLVLARVGPVPAEDETVRRPVLAAAVRELGLRADHRGVTLAVETGTEPGSVLTSFLTGLNLPTLAASIDPARLLLSGFDPVETVKELGPLVAHAYANDASRAARSNLIANPRGIGFPPGTLDWEEFLGALEEVNYRGFLTVSAEPPADLSSAFKSVLERVKRF